VFWSWDGEKEADISLLSCEHIPIIWQISTSVCGIFARRAYFHEQACKKFLPRLIGSDWLTWGAQLVGRKIQELERRIPLKGADQRQGSKRLDAAI
jgi:hypothetical protein